MPYLTEPASGQRRKQQTLIFGGDYDTPRTAFLAVRDYIHVTDLAQGHVAAIKKFVQYARDVPVQPRELGIIRA